ncbi:MAG TPA: thioredoxin domain-containing protein [Terriglobia bacterium]|nr:thioredoxin domain-containing protein [Terriglobia bacterium]
MPNRLINETSPYLLQHAHNPVDWHAWGSEALERAAKEDKPILLSIGYSACHWCHVMEHESFENESVARIMNDNFINIKVDREERPDLDQIYMTAVQMMTGSGGWPLTVFLLPTGVPIFGGTYFPPDDRFGRPGFRRVLEAISEAYRTRRDEIVANSKGLLEQLDRQTLQQSEDAEIDANLLDLAYRTLSTRFDPREGGFGGAPKFPPGMSIDFLLRYHHRADDEHALHMATLTLDKMAFGGMYDQVGGGFHRYSTDDRWLVPHFEKMLYDNALLARAYLDAYRTTGAPLYKRITEETLDFVVREMRNPSGAFYSTQDADSEGVEGKFYVWTLEEFRQVVGPDAEILAKYFDVTQHGNWEERNILNVPRPPELFSKLEKLSLEELAAMVDAAKKKLYAVRETRVKPGRDEKVLTDWNGLMLRAFADAATYLGRDDYRAVAEANANFILTTLWDGKRLLHSFKDGRARFNGYLDDYANFADGLFALYELTLDYRWIEKAVQVADRMIEQFWDAEGGGFYFTAKDHESLITRTKDYFDNATPSGNSIAADVLLRLAALLDRPDYRDKAEQIFRTTFNLLREHASGFGRMLAAVDFYVGPSREVAIVGKPDEFMSVLRRHYLPRTVVAAGSDNRIALLRDRPMVGGKPTAYVCENFTCKQPVTDSAAFEKQLNAG